MKILDAHIHLQSYVYPYVYIYIYTHYTILNCEMYGWMDGWMDGWMQYRKLQLHTYILCIYICVCYTWLRVFIYVYIMICNVYTYIYTVGSCLFCLGPDYHRGLPRRMGCWMLRTSTGSSLLKPLGILRRKSILRCSTQFCCACWKLRHFKTVQVLPRFIFYIGYSIRSNALR